MKRITAVLFLLLVVAVAPSSFACWRCDTTVGCYGTDVGVPGYTDCVFDGTCHNIRPLCQGLRESAAPLAAKYTVASVHVVTPHATPQPAQAKPAPVMVASR